MAINCGVEYTFQIEYHYFPQYKFVTQVSQEFVRCQNGQYLVGLQLSKSVALSPRHMCQFFVMSPVSGQDNSWSGRPVDARASTAQDSQPANRRRQMCTALFTSLHVPQFLAYINAYSTIQRYSIQRSFVVEQ